jgi:uncharacterized cofD-like protein
MEAFLASLWLHMHMSGTERKSVVVLGGGTGTYTLLSGLKQYADRIAIHAIVTMADSGGSTGRLRDEFGYLPVGDARSALAALARETEGGEDILRKLFLYRFDRGEGLSGHTFGNLFLVALTDILGSEAKAIEVAGKILATCGEVIPVTHDNVHLVAEFTTGEVLTNEHDIDEGSLVGKEALIKELKLSTPARISARAKEVIANADLVVLGPGDLYTSILANCIVDGVPEALQDTRARLVYVLNLMSRNGQANGMGSSDYIAEIKKYVGREPDFMLVHNGPLREDLLMHYKNEGEYPVLHTYTGGSVVEVMGDFVSQEDVSIRKGDTVRRSLIRHDPEKLARAIISLILK